MGMSPRPSSSGSRALPITAPKALRGSVAFIACPGVWAGREEIANLDWVSASVYFAVDLAH
jgi:hypothetical protein